MNTDALFSSAKQDWTTPRGLFDRLDAELAFTLDAAASDTNALCAHYFTEADDALSRPWPGRVWLNYPYGAQGYRWLQKAWHEAYGGSARLVVVLAPARTDTKGWHQYAMEGDRDA